MDEIRDGSETPDTLPHCCTFCCNSPVMYYNQALSQKQKIGGDLLIRRGLHLRLHPSHFQPAVRFFQLCMTELWLGLELRSLRDTRSGKTLGVLKLLRSLIQSLSRVVTKLVIDLLVPDKLLGVCATHQSHISRAH